MPTAWPRRSIATSIAGASTPSRSARPNPNKEPPMEAATIAVWGGEDASHRLGHSTQVAIVPGVAFGYDDLEEWRDVALGRAPGHIYSRNSNPTVAAFEGKVRSL